MPSFLVFVLIFPLILIVHAQKVSSFFAYIFILFPFWCSIHTPSLLTLNYPLTPPVKFPLFKAQFLLHILFANYSQKMFVISESRL